ncbi:MAG: retron St85 family RNA-directed DNA polymerase [Rhizobium rhizophilum]|uniref:retron St85 family RNA-directed DNA polymerase n=1 Tax=Rhizobium rhizophilum TaxID=1850373 RepID=UPI00391B9CE0
MNSSELKCLKGVKMADAFGNLIQNCAEGLALTASELFAIARTAPKRYFVWEIEKRSGKGTRTVCHPARELKAVQYYFLNHILTELPVHEAACAYVHGSSIKKNASAHAKSRVIMKIDFADFFGSLLVTDWARYASEHFPMWSTEDINFSGRILFWGRGSYEPTCLAIGAPTSPLLSNALMFEIDVYLKRYAQEHDLTYTRYADDITFSSKNWLDYDSTLGAVRDALSSAKYSSISINESKTVLASNGSTRRVTGLILTPDNKISLGRDRKRRIAAMAHRAHLNSLAEKDWPILAGLLAFAADVEPEFLERLGKKYSPETLLKVMQRQSG